MTNDLVTGGLKRSFANRKRSSGTLGTIAFVAESVRVPAVAVEETLDPQRPARAACPDIIQPILQAIPDRRPSSKAPPVSLNSRRQKTGQRRAFSDDNAFSRASRDPDHAATFIIPPLLRR